MRFFVTAAKGTEPALRDELRELRLPRVRADHGGVHFEGTMPDASPEWTPSVSTRTVNVPAAMPRSEVVSHSRSQSPQPESRQTTSDGSPIFSFR